ncbi:uncharacterized protein LY89DRAFT_715356 [Mollisia scopiformis]|uniref:Uncharacterized protein n=1 Tax=Mollisia scopiformis TaxID=149040 RepID=A0A194XLW2_MOLSC|nr:uncharacterized protein LY89DRAFT_715356 [Mollisia scopiformis]KUJ21074.1 hypothetical protein LY89DRAFT_715356 [Mollisia scopiformis]
MSSYESVLSSLLPPSQPHIFSSLPISPHKALIPSQQISSLEIHPVLESALHILNLDLPSAHFLLRHMQADPVFEAMYLHGILHRVEGDIDNARAWYSDVKDQDVFRAAWPGKNGLDDAVKFLGRIEERKVNRGKRDEMEDEELSAESLREMKAVIGFCEGKFGTEKLSDASQVWVSMSEKNSTELIMYNWRETQHFPVPDFDIEKNCKNSDALLDYQETHKVSSTYGLRDKMVKPDDPITLPLPPHLKAFLEAHD